MSQREVLIPDASHPITVTATEGRVTVFRGERKIADTTQALTLAEASYPPVQYVPLADVDSAVLQPSDHASYCPFKGEASYYSLDVDGDRADDAVWTYEAPYDAVADIAGHVAFYPDQVRIEVG
ncbi:DUF427 domain-containing protein [Nocardioides flavescens]|uniref:DUF427 domain-containing protein n=1 Tax=Nocardioides flavescens TaxID=2691959 RepID=A0A6L7F215_9ACTN|nr:DUF427 domain-containing protein [Nocardioides flavescens]MXG91605.1 DUF427 domain-containing protein [Nocardioides flavescens]